MRLFSSTDIQATESASASAPVSHRQSGRTSQHLIKSRATLARVIGRLVPDESIQFATAGSWSLHQLLEHILAQTGPAAVWMTTWTITEDPMRALLTLLRSGAVTELHAVFDYRIERRKPEAFQLASNILTRIKLTKCHAKVLVVQNDRWSVTVLGSANIHSYQRIDEFFDLLQALLEHMLGE